MADRQRNCHALGATVTRKRFDFALLPERGRVGIPAYRAKVTTAAQSSPESDAISKPGSWHEFKVVFSRTTSPRMVRMPSARACSMINRMSSGPSRVLSDRIGPGWRILRFRSLHQRANEPLPAWPWTTRRWRQTPMREAVVGPLAAKGRRQTNWQRSEQQRTSGHATRSFEMTLMTQQRHRAGDSNPPVAVC